MSREFRKIEVTFTVKDSEHLPRKADGSPLYADDVYEMLRMAIKLGTLDWYNSVGHHYLTIEPEV